MPLSTPGPQADRGPTAGRNRSHQGSASGIIGSIGEQLEMLTVQRLCGVFCYAFAALWLRLSFALAASLLSLARQVDDDKGGVRGGAPAPGGRKFLGLDYAFGSAFAASGLCCLLRLWQRLCYAFAASLLRCWQRLCGVFATLVGRFLRRVGVFNYALAVLFRPTPSF